MVDEWDKHMEGFTPELLLTFPLPGRSDEFFYEVWGSRRIGRRMRLGFRFQVQVLLR